MGKLKFWSFASNNKKKPRKKHQEQLIETLQAENADLENKHEQLKAEYRAIKDENENLMRKNWELCNEQKREREQWASRLQTLSSQLEDQRQTINFQRRITEENQKEKGELETKLKIREKENTELEQGLEYGLKKKEEELHRMFKQTLLRQRDEMFHLLSTLSTKVESAEILRSIQKLDTDIKAHLEMLMDLDNTVKHIMATLLKKADTPNTNEFNHLSGEVQEACQRLLFIVGPNWKGFGVVMGLEPMEVQAMEDEPGNYGLQELYWKVISLCQERGCLSIENLKEACRVMNIDLNHGSPMPLAHRNLMDKLHGLLVENIVEARFVLPNLRELAPLTPATMEYILQPRVPNKGIERLLEIVQYTLGLGERCLPVFIQSLRNSGHDFAAQALEKAVADQEIEMDMDNTCVKSVVSDGATATLRCTCRTISSPVTEEREKKRSSKRKSAEELDFDDDIGDGPLIFKWNQFSSPRNKRRKLPAEEETSVMSIDDFGTEIDETSV